MISREEHRNIKKMGRKQFDAYITDIFNQGFNAGVSAMASKVSEKVEQGVRNCPGIGEKRYTAILDSINKEFNGGEINVSAE